MNNTLPPFEDLINTVQECDALELLRALPDNSIDLIATDPPYFNMVDHEWDRQWESQQVFLGWLREHIIEFRRVLKPNGSLYLFASPRMAAQVEVLIGLYFNVLNQLVWYKTTGNRNWAADKEEIRAFLPNTERIIFAESMNADKTAAELAGFRQAETSLKKRIFGDYLAGEWARAGVTYHEITEAIGAYNRHNHGGAASNWALGYNCPTADQYEKMRLYLNNQRHKGAPFLVADYEFLRREYEDLRREYEDLRRPFFATAKTEFTDVWNFAPVQSYPGKHPTEKPLSLMSHIIQSSSKPGAIVLDPFCGSGTTLDAARRLGRAYIGGDKDSHWAAYARERLAQPYTLPMFTDDPAPEPAQQERLFGDDVV